MRLRFALSVALSAALGALASCSSEPETKTDVRARATVVEQNLREMDDFVEFQTISDLRDDYGLFQKPHGPQWKARDYFYKKYERPGVTEIDLSGVEITRRLATATEPRGRAPSLLARIDKPELEELPLEALRVTTILTATRARTLIDMTYKNDSDRALEGTLLVDLPDGASPCYLGVFQGAGPKKADDPASLLPPPIEDPKLLLTPVPTLTSSSEWGELRPARVVEAEQGVQVYEETTRRRVDPALMEWSAANAFRTRIFPVPAKGRKRVALVYDQPALTAGERAIVPLAVPAKLPASFRLEVAASTVAFEKPALVTAEGESALEARDGFARAERASAPSTGALVLAASPKNAAVSAAFGAVDGVPGSLVHARVRPALRAGEPVKTGSAVFLLDTSLSQRTALAPLCAKLLRQILEKDGSLERFEVIAFDVTARPLTTGWASNTWAEREALSERLASFWLEGATNVAGALDEAEKALAGAEHPTFFLLSDGVASWGIEDPRELERAHPRLFAERWIAYAFGDKPLNRSLAGALTREAGRIVPVLSADAIQAAAIAHTSRPRALKALTVTGIATENLAVAGEPKQLSAGEVLDVTFRTGDDPRKATIRLELEDGRDGFQDFALAGAEGPSAVAARAWAELTASALLALEDRDADQVAVALSQRFALANRVASFLMLETDAEYKTRAIKTEDLEIEKLTRAARERFTARPAYAPRTDALDQAALAFLESAKKGSCAPWPRSVGPAQRTESFGKTSWPERLEPLAVHEEAERRFQGGRADEALRVLSSIVEENPRDGASLRLVAFTLMGWERFEDAERVFARAREVRPFEPQAYLGEALALDAQGRLAEAALRYEIVLAGKFDPRYEAYAKEAAKRLYGRLLARAQGLPEAAARPAALGLAAGAPYELHLLWNLDATDIDLHVIEQDETEVDYKKKRSPSGGELLWDNTAGLGPEIYVHAKLAPRSAFVHYYGSNAVSGRAPAAVLTVFFEGSAVRCRACILREANARTTVFEQKSRSP